jgi:NADH dehydrogenase/NADH:ubiquinone oxidoreductase subunit G
MVTITVNGKLVKAQEGEMLLAVLKRTGHDIPAMCDHAAVEPYGGCRLCSVEIRKKGWDEDWTKVVTSCLYPVEDGLVVQTHTPEIVELRKTLIDLLLARCPKTAAIQKLAEDYGVFKTTYEERPDADDCILCALCTRVCDAMGFSAISAEGRGHGREISPPLNAPPPDCTGCLACAKVCPTGHIKYEDNGATLKIWGKTFEKMQDKTTGEYTITKEFAQHLSKHRDIPEEYFEHSDASHRKQTATKMGRIAQWTREAAK